MLLQNSSWCLQVCNKKIFLSSRFHRIAKNIKIGENSLLNIEDKIIDVDVVFGGCSMYPTKYYNLYKYDCDKIKKDKIVCEHFDFMRNFREKGRVIINTDIKLIMKEFEK